MSTGPLDLAGHHRLYLDNNVWDLIASHPNSNEIAALLAEPGARLAMVSMVTAVETLRAPEAIWRRNAALMRPSLLVSNHVLPHPTYVLANGVIARRRRLPYLESREDEIARALKAMLLGQIAVEPDDLNQMAQWIEQQKNSFRTFVRAVRDGDTRNRQLLVDKSWLDNRELRRMLISYAPEATLNRREVHLLFYSIPAWAALGYQIGISIEVANRNGDAVGLGPDMLQTPYLGLANEFVTNDDGFLHVAHRVCDLLRDRPGYLVRATSAKDFFKNIGYPHPNL